MALAEQVYAQSLLLAGELEPRQEVLLQGFSAAAERRLRGKLRPGVAAEDCGENFIMAAALYALAMLLRAGGDADVASFSVGDISVSRRDGESGAQRLTAQADGLLAGYLADSLSFRGV